MACTDDESPLLKSRVVLEWEEQESAEKAVILEKLPIEGEPEAASHVTVPVRNL